MSMLADNDKVKDNHDKGDDVVGSGSNEIEICNDTNNNFDTNNNNDDDDGWEELMGKDLMMKSIHLPDPDTPSVQPQDVVIVDFEGRYSPATNVRELDDTFLQHWINSNDYDDNNNINIDCKYPIFHTGEKWLIIIGEKDVLPALEMGIRFMQVGQTCLIYSHPKYAYGLSGRKSNNKSSMAEPYILSPDSNVIYKVTVTEIVSSTDIQTKLRICESKKKIGNDIYNYEIQYDRTGSYTKSRAINMYKRASDMLEYLILKHQKLQDEKQDDDDNNHEDTGDDDNIDFTNFDKTYATELFLDCLNNITAVHMISKDYHAAKEAAVNVLSRDPHNIKGLIRAAKAAMMDPASAYEEVEASIQAAIAEASIIRQNNSLDRSSNLAMILSDIDKLRHDLQRRKQQYNQRKKQMSTNIAKGLQQNNQSSINKEKKTAVPTATTTTPVTMESKANVDLKTIKQETITETEQEKDKVMLDVHETADNKKNEVGLFSSFVRKMMDEWNKYPTATKNNIIWVYGFQVLFVLVMLIYFKRYNHPILFKQEETTQPQDL